MILRGSKCFFEHNLRAGYPYRAKYVTHWNGFLGDLNIFLFFFYLGNFQLTNFASTVDNPLKNLVHLRDIADKNNSISFEVVRHEETSIDLRHIPSELGAYMIHYFINAYDTSIRTPLSHAVEKGHTHVVQWLLSLPGIDVEKGGEHHGEYWTPLHYAARYGRVDAVNLLLQHEAHVNAITSKKKSTALHLACATGSVDCVNTLLKNGANTQLEDIFQCTPFSLAIHFNEKLAQEALFQSNIEISQHDCRKLRRDDHMYRRFHWIKLARPVICNNMLRHLSRLLGIYMHDKGGDKSLL
ncbi:hypothetical protein RFI_31367 [Reticulomyxa filosa]|uniref:Uncharacterized protein n=1 Tax=Reticulomyxa filosa TaxID=46433 RepID=X6LWN9_RETFI|nr:hypothetical protein RFI_31367 [Reticulomyxa filosa]|eukprot:ETO06029.1 hypothetical protein RFI_31367 [Reticulomyxa filosa]